MKTYWDLEESERAKLTEEEVSTFVDAELMTKGVLKARPPKLIEVPNIDSLKRKFFVARSHGRYGGIEDSVAFRTEEEALAFRKSDACCVSSEYLNGTHVTIARRYEELIGVLDLVPYDDYQEHAAVLEKYTAAVAANEKLQEEYEQAVKKQTETLKGLWADWHRCRALDAKMQEIIQVFQDYKCTCDGDALLATKFLQKVYGTGQIKDAAQWTGVVIPQEFAAEHQHEHDDQCSTQS